jgi:hypothetical protein
VESFELNVPLISTVNNYADFFTKTLKPGSFHGNLFSLDITCVCGSLVV